MNNTLKIYVTNNFQVAEIIAKASCLEFTSKDYHQKVLAVNTNTTQKNTVSISSEEHLTRVRFIKLHEMKVNFFVDYTAITIANYGSLTCSDQLRFKGLVLKNLVIADADLTVTVETYEDALEVYKEYEHYFRHSSVVKV